MTITRPSPLSVDRRPGIRAGATCLVTGGVLFAVGNLLHPLEHDDHGLHSPTWAAAHLTFALGALLMAGGLAALGPRLAASRLGIAGLLLSAVGMVFVVGSAYPEVYIAPVVGIDTVEEISASATLWNLVTLVSYVVGPVLVAVAGLWHRALPVLACVGLLAAQVVTVAGPALPVAAGWWLIPGTAVFGLAFALAGASVLRSRS